ncbi:hypothetical protein D8674_033784 [Pyrus ussuriensis x Pyrus communis]|uniref:Uncharacterized protein n=1 Tax=Pyrus ussuriensis x Pyrus communis TaxID=2448454 RepID=A0A5N5HM29_9ROSA|nr:hypothetical protein D8674_033784 [Pyrus ussuriensis x Pyrus communis]
MAAEVRQRSMTNLVAAGLSRDDLLRISRWWFRQTTSEIVVDAESGGCGSGREHKVGTPKFRPTNLVAVVQEESTAEPSNEFSSRLCRISSSMSSSRHKNDDGAPPLYRQGGSLSKVGDFKISSNDSFIDFFEAYRHAVPSGLRSHHRLFDHSSKGDHDWANDTLEINSVFGSTSKASPNMKMVHIALGIHSEYREWRWLLSHLCQEKDGIPSKEKIKRIKAEALARSITIVEPAANEATSSIPDKIARRRNFVVPPMPKFVPKHPSGTKFSSPSERLTTMKSDKVPLLAKVALKLVLSAAETDSSTEKKETACVGSCEKSTKFASGKTAEICALLKPDLLEDMDVCVKFIDGIKWVVGPKLIVAYNQMIHFKKVVDRLEPQVLELQGVLKINDSLRKKVEELQHVHAGYVDHLFGRLSDFEFAGKDFETFTISLKDLLALTLKVSIGKVVGEVDAQVGTVGAEESDGTVVESVAAIEGVVT